MAHKALAGKMAELEQIVASHDWHIKTFLAAIRQRMDQLTPKFRRMGFKR